MKKVYSVITLWAIGIFLYQTIYPASAHAENFYLCDGVWSSVACEDRKARDSSFSVSRIETPKLSDSEQEKRHLLHDFERTRLELAREHGFYFRPGLEESTCLNPESSVETCNKAIIESEQRLLARIEMEKQSREEKVTKHEGDNIAISVNESHYYRYPWFRRDPHKRKPTPPPVIGKGSENPWARPTPGEPSPGLRR